MNVQSKRPISFAPDVINWFSYKSGILSNCGCQIDYGAFAVGYTNEYWKVKSSWGPTWGENGFIRIALTCNVYGFG